MGYSHTNAKGKKYFLNSKDVNLKGGRQQTIYYFSKDERTFEMELSSTGSTISISLFGSSFLICSLKFCDWGTHPAILKFTFSSFVLPSTINSFNLFI